MIIGFEEITKELTQAELRMVGDVSKILLSADGKRNAVKNGEIANYLLAMYGKKISSPRIRKIIQYIRITGKVERLIATSKGYYVSKDPLELSNYIKSLLQRASAIEQLAHQLEYQTDTKFRTGQKQLFR